MFGIVRIADLDDMKSRGEGIRTPNLDYDDFINDVIGARYRNDPQQLILDTLAKYKCCTLYLYGHRGYHGNQGGITHFPPGLEDDTEGKWHNGIVVLGRPKGERLHTEPKRIYNPGLARGSDYDIIPPRNYSQIIHGLEETLRSIQFEYKLRAAFNRNGCTGCVINIMACGDGNDDNAELNLVLKAIANNTGCKTCGSDKLFKPGSGEWSHSCQHPDEGNKLSDVPSASLGQPRGKGPYRIR